MTRAFSAMFFDNLLHPALDLFRYGFTVPSPRETALVHDASRKIIKLTEAKRVGYALSVNYHRWLPAFPWASDTLRGPKFPGLD